MSRRTIRLQTHNVCFVNHFLSVSRRNITIARIPNSVASARKSVAFISAAGAFLEGGGGIRKVYVTNARCANDAGGLIRLIITKSCVVAISRNSANEPRCRNRSVIGDALKGPISTSVTRNSAHAETPIYCAEVFRRTARDRDGIIFFNKAYNTAYVILPRNGSFVGNVRIGSGRGRGSVPAVIHA